MSPEALVVYNKLNAAEKATLLKEIGQKKEEGREEGRKEERKRGVCYKPHIWHRDFTRLLLIL